MNHEAARGHDADDRDDAEHATEQEATEQEATDQGGGAVSEVGNLGDGTPIDPDQAVGGSPDPEVQEGKQGPNARTGNEEPGN